VGPEAAPEDQSLRGRDGRDWIDLHEPELTDRVEHVRRPSVEELRAHRDPPKPQHEGASRAELDATAAWIRRDSNYYRRECARLGLPYVDVGDLGFDAAMIEARRHLLT
jgi:hypothetical protein